MSVFFSTRGKSFFHAWKKIFPREEVKVLSSLPSRSRATTVAGRTKNLTGSIISWYCQNHRHGLPWLLHHHHRSLKTYKRCPAPPAHLWPGSADIYPYCG